MSQRIRIFTSVLVYTILALGSLVRQEHQANANLLADPNNPSAHQTLQSPADRFFPEMGSPMGVARLHVPHGQVLPATSNQETGASKALPADCWTIVSSPSPGSTYNQLVSISAVSPNDIWAVGGYCINCGTETETGQTLIEHWNGSAWSLVPSPNAGTSDNFLYGVTATSTSDAWAVGIFFDGTRLETLTLHWNGRSWSIVPSPNPGDRNNYLNSVDAISPNDVWAVGTYRIVGGPLATLIEHWNGSAWSVVSNPNIGSSLNSFTGVSASKPNDVWAVGFYCTDADCTTAAPLIEHYDGSAWSVVAHPFPASVNSTYWGVLAVSAKDVWFGGSYSSDGSTWTNLLTHYDGSNLSETTLQSPGSYNNDIESLAAIGPNNVWAVGDFDAGIDYPFGRTQVQHYSGPCR